MWQRALGCEGGICGPERVGLVYSDRRGRGRQLSAVGRHRPIPYRLRDLSRASKVSFSQREMIRLWKIGISSIGDYCIAYLSNDKQKLQNFLARAGF